ncbi:major facilitator superfamily domain-containing protein [Ochromonadaceae sp. CCMP2298]|nr:major facilitator superfamily domain-containing protein [Ochromonadaceae sp. CCMP2298]
MLPTPALSLGVEMGAERRSLLFLNTIIDTISWSMLLPSMPQIHASFTLTNIEIGMLASLLSCLTFAGGTVQGAASDYLGRLRLLQASALAQTLGHLLLFIALQRSSLALFVAARSVPALFKCGMVVSQAYLCDQQVGKSQQDVSQIGSLMACSNVAFVVGPLLGGVAYSANPQYPALLGVVLGVGSLALLQRMEQLSAAELTHMPTPPHLPLDAPDSGQEPQKPQTIPKTPGGGGASSSSIPSSSSARSSVSSGTAVTLLHLLHAKFAFQLGNGAYEAFFMQRAHTLGLSGSSMGALLSLSGVCSALTNRFILRWVDRLGGGGMGLRVYVGGLGVGLVGWALSRTLSSFVVSMVLVTISSNLFLSSIQSRIGKTVTPHTHTETGEPEGQEDELAAGTKGGNLGIGNLGQFLRGAGAGTVYGLSSAVDRAARVLVPILGGYILQSHGDQGLACLFLCAAAYCLLLLSYPSLPLLGESETARKKVT